MQGIIGIEVSLNGSFVTLKLMLINDTLTTLALVFSICLELLSQIVPTT